MLIVRTHCSRRLHGPAPFRRLGLLLTISEFRQKGEDEAVTCMWSPGKGTPAAGSAGYIPLAKHLKIATGGTEFKQS